MNQKKYKVRLLSLQKENRKGTIIWPLLRAKRYTDIKEMVFLSSCTTSQSALICCGYSFTPRTCILCDDTPSPLLRTGILKVEEEMKGRKMRDVAQGPEFNLIPFHTQRPRSFFQKEAQRRGWTLSGADMILNSTLLGCSCISLSLSCFSYLPQSSVAMQRALHPVLAL